MTDFSCEELESIERVLWDREQEALGELLVAREGNGGPRVRILEMRHEKLKALHTKVGRLWRELSAQSGPHHVSVEIVAGRKADRG